MSAQGESSGDGAGCVNDKSGLAECVAPSQDKSGVSAGCASDKSGGEGSAAPTRDESARRISNGSDGTARGARARQEFAVRERQ